MQPARRNSSVSLGFRVTATRRLLPLRQASEENLIGCRRLVQDPYASFSAEFTQIR